MQFQEPGIGHAGFLVATGEIQVVAHRVGVARAEQDIPVIRVAHRSGIEQDEGLLQLLLDLLPLSVTGEGRGVTFGLWCNQGQRSIDGLEAEGYLSGASDHTTCSEQRPGPQASI